MCDLLDGQPCQRNVNPCCLRHKFAVFQTVFIKQPEPPSQCLGKEHIAEICFILGGTCSGSVRSRATGAPDGKRKCHVNFALSTSKIMNCVFLNSKEIYLCLRTIITYGFTCFADIFHCDVGRINILDIRVFELDSRGYDAHPSDIPLHGIPR